MPPAEPAPLDARAEEALLAYLAANDPADEHGFAKFCAERPGIERDLHRLMAGWCFLEDLREAPGGAADPGPLRRVAARGPIDRYRIARSVAAGGMGIVREAWDSDLARRVAMKVAPVPVTAGDDVTARKLLARFVEEAQVTARLDHPGVVPVHDLGVDDDGCPFFTMRLVEGRELGEVFALAREGREEWSVPRAVGVLARVCETLAFAHSKGIVHRDLKPANVMVGRFGETYVVDWGLAKIAGGEGEEHAESRGLGRAGELRTLAGAVIGTPGFLAPEQATGDATAIAPPTDVYAVGAMLYLLLTARRPYADDGCSDADTIVARTRRGPPTPVAKLARRAPSELVAICEQAMAHEPADRYPDCAALGADLQAFLDQRVVRAHRTGALAEARKWIARNRGVAIAGGVALILAVGGPTAHATIQARARADLAAEQARTRFEGAIANLGAARAALSVHDVAEARLRLRRVPDDLRGWEWRHLRSRIDQSLRTLRGHEGPVTRARFDPGGTRIVTASRDRTLRLWEVATGRCERVLRGHEGSVVAAAFTAGGERIVSASEDGTVRSWSVAADVPPRVIEVGVAVHACTLEPGGNRCAAALADKTIAVLDLESGARLATLRGHRYDVIALDWSPDRKIVASGGSDGSVWLWDAVSGTRIDVLAESGHKVGRVRFSADGRRLLVSRDRIEVFDLASRALLAAWDGREAGGVGGCACFAPGDDSRVWVAGQDGAVRAWNPVDGRITAVLRGIDTTVVDLASSVDGARLVTADWSGMVKLWDPEIESDVAVLGHTLYVYDVAFDPNGERLVSCDHQYAVRLWDRASGALLATFWTPQGAFGAAWSPDGARLAVAGRDGFVRLLDGETFLEIANTHAGNWLECIAWSPCGRWLATGGRTADEDALELWDARTLQRVEFVTRSGPVRSVAFDAAGERLAVAGDTATIEVRAVPSGQLVASLHGHEAGVQHLAFDPGGRTLASASRDGTVRLWDAQRGRETTRLDGHAGEVRALVWSPDGRRLVSGGEDRDLLVWDPANGRELVRLRGHAWDVMALAWSPDGETIASASRDRTVRLWDTRPAAERSAARGRDERSIAGVVPHVERLIAQHGSLAAIAAALRDEEADPRRRADALRVAHAELDDPRRSIDAVWRVAVQSDRSPADYLRALRLAAWAHSLEEADPRALRAFAVAHYRVGAFDGAIDRLSHLMADGAAADHLAEARAVLAMALFRVGEKARAREALAAARDALRVNPSASGRQLVHEAAQLLGEVLR